MQGLPFNSTVHDIHVSSGVPALVGPRFLRGQWHRLSSMSMNRDNFVTRPEQSTRWTGSPEHPRFYLQQRTPKMKHYGSLSVLFVALLPSLVVV